MPLVTTGFPMPICMSPLKSYDMRKAATEMLILLKQYINQRRLISLQ